MTIRYYSAGKNPYECAVRLHDKKITEWGYRYDLGYKPNGCLDIGWVKISDNDLGIAPPVDSIINHNEVFNWLNSNFKHLRK